MSQPLLDGVSFDPYDVSVRVDPYPHYRRLRDQAPAYYVEERDFWLLSRYDDVNQALRQPAVFSSAEGIAVERIVNLADLGLEGAEFMTEIMISKDPPDHTRIRRLVQKEFTPSHVARWESKIRAICDRLFDEFAERNAAGEADLTRDLATPLPVIVIAEVLGIPPEEREQFKDWSEQVVYMIGGGIDPTLQFSAIGAAMELAEYFGQIADQRRKEPGDDLVSLFVRAGEGDDALTRDEIVGNCVLFLIGGNETTTNLIGNAAKALLAHPDQFCRLEEDPSLVPVALEEVLRWDAPVQGLFRTTRAPVDIDGTTIPADARVQLLYGSANRDERHFPDPDVFDIARNPRDHFAFGGAAHYCIGAPLARLEARAVLEALLQRTRNLHLTGEPQLNINVLVRGPRSLPVAFDPAV
jgi:cytochrome P450